MSSNRAYVGRNVLYRPIGSVDDEGGDWIAAIITRVDAISVWLTVFPPGSAPVFFRDVRFKPHGDCAPGECRLA